MNYKSGFTLIELLVVIAIIASLAVTVFLAVNPGKRIAVAQNQGRIQNATTILDAVHSYVLDSAGQFPYVITNNGNSNWNSTTLTLPETQIGKGTSGCGPLTTGGCSVGAGVTQCIDLAKGTSQGIAAYLASNPVDNGFSSATTNYTIAIANGIVTIKNCNAANNSSYYGTSNISISR